jgi:hypothetical protein
VTGNSDIDPRTRSENDAPEAAGTHSTADPANAAASEQNLAAPPAISVSEQKVLEREQQEKLRRRLKERFH